MNPIFDRHFADLSAKCPRVSQDALPSGPILITIDAVPLPTGWNKETTSVRFLAPVGYPFSQPDCFWADPNLRLANGLVPQASNDQPIPDINAPGTWFSWHVQQWNPNKDSLTTYYRVIEQRLKQAQ